MIRLFATFWSVAATENEGRSTPYLSGATNSAMSRNQETVLRTGHVGTLRVSRPQAILKAYGLTKPFR